MSPTKVTRTNTVRLFSSSFVVMRSKSRALEIPAAGAMSRPSRIRLMKRARMRLSSVNMVLPGTLLVLACVRRSVGAIADIIFSWN